MPLSERAAQFSPFAALTGYGDAIDETGRLTDAKVELAEDAGGILDGKLRLLQERIGIHKEVSVTYFQPDGKKAGGAYVTVVGLVKKIDRYEQALVFQDGTKIPIPEITKIEGEIFSQANDL